MITREELKYILEVKQWNTKVREHYVKVMAENSVLSKAISKLIPKDVEQTRIFDTIDWFIEFIERQIDHEITPEYVESVWLLTKKRKS